MRSKQAKPYKYSGKYRKYDPDNLVKAHQDVKEKKISIRSAALQYGLPYQTLRDRVSGRVDIDDFGNETVLTREEELSLVEHAEHSAKLGYGFSNKGLQKTGGEIAHMLGRRVTDKPLSNCWLYGFLKRWKSRISSLKPSALETNRAKYTTPEIVDTYFSNLEKTIQNHGLRDKPEFIYNLDETGISPEHRPPNVIAPLGAKAQAVTSPRSSSTTLIGCANAAGNHLPPYFVFKGKRMNNLLMQGTTPGARAVMSDSGWSTAAVFREYLENHFLQHVRRGQDDTQPILLILDGHSTHTSREMIEWALTKHIILFVLPAHSSHVLQPLDVAVFGPFKRYYYSECASFMREKMGKVITKYEMAAIACKAYLKAMSPWNIIAAFRKTGIYTLSKEAVPTDRLLPCEGFRDDTPILKVKAMAGGKQAIDTYLQNKQVQSLAKSTHCTCACETKTKADSLKKPIPGGKEITSDSFIQELNCYQAEKENIKPSKPNKENRRNTGKHTSPKPSTSGLNVVVGRPDEESDVDEDDSEPCCVCGRASPPNLSNMPYLKIVNWAKCDSCLHWVHLAFCHEKRVLRRGDSFLCPHCC